MDIKDFIHESNENIGFKVNSDLNKEEQKHIFELERSSHESKNKIIDILKSLEKLPIAITDGHYRLGLHARYILDLEKKVPHYFFGIFAGYKRKTNKEIIVKNVFEGNLYITDHCFMKLKNTMLDSNVSYGDIIVFSAVIDFYSKIDKNSGRRLFNFGLISISTVEKYKPNFKSITNNITRTSSQPILIDKLRELTKFYTINSELPIDFFDKFIMSILTYKTKEFKLMADEFDYKNEFNERCYNIILKSYVIMLYYIDKGCIDNINFIELQSVIRHVIKSEINLMAYALQMQSNKLELDDTDDIYSMELYKLLGVIEPYKLNDVQLSEIDKKCNNKYDDIIQQSISFINSLFIEE